MNLQGGTDTHLYRMEESCHSQGLFSPLADGRSSALFSNSSRFFKLREGFSQKRSRSVDIIKKKHSLPKQISLQYLSTFLNDINLDADDQISLFERYRQSGCVTVLINGQIVIRKRRHWKTKLKASRNFYEPVKRKIQIPETVIDETEITPKIIIQVGCSLFSKWSFRVFPVKTF